MSLLCAAFMYFQSFLFFYDSMKSKLTLRYILTVPRVPAVPVPRYLKSVGSARRMPVQHTMLLWAQIRKEFCESDQAESRALDLMYSR